MRKFEVPIFLYALSKKYAEIHRVLSLTIMNIMYALQCLKKGGGKKGDKNLSFIYSKFPCLKECFLGMEVTHECKRWSPG